MQRHIAEAIVAAGAEWTRQMSLSLIAVQAKGTPQEFETYREAVAPIIADLFHRVMLPALMVHPDLSPPTLRELVEWHRARDGG